MNKKQLFEMILNEGQTEFTNHLGEKDYFDDPYKDESIYDPKPEDEIGSDDGVAEFLKKFESHGDYRTLSGLDRLASTYYYYADSDYIHDIRHDGDYAGSINAEHALNKFKSKILNAVDALGLDANQCRCSLRRMVLAKERSEEYKKKIAAQTAARNATRKANQPARFERYKKLALDTISCPELVALLNDDGSLKERSSWGVIKNYLRSPEGKLLKNLWVNQFGD